MCKWVRCIKWMEEDIGGVSDRSHFAVTKDKRFPVRNGRNINV